jgi:hypothetical protein
MTSAYKEVHPMPSEHTFDEPGTYRIRVKGKLGQRWADWFEGFTITQQANGDTLLFGTVVDQAALYGVLNRIRDLHLSLLLVERVESKEHFLGDKL